MNGVQSVLGLIGRTQPLFEADVAHHAARMQELVTGGRFLVIGGAGSIGQAVTREIFKRGPQVLHVVDISENNMVELVRDIRSTLGYIEGDFATFAIDCGSREFEALMHASGGYDYVLNLSALKHVRSEKDPFTLMRLIEVNVLNTVKTIELARSARRAQIFLRLDRQGRQPGEHDGCQQAHHGNVSDARQLGAAAFRPRVLPTWRFRMARCCTALTSALPSASPFQPPTTCGAILSRRRSRASCA